MIVTAETDTPCSEPTCDEPVNENTMTDDQVRRLRRMTLGQPVKSAEDYELIAACEQALRRSDDRWLRGPLAAAWNARQGKEGR